MTNTAQKSKSVWYRRGEAAYRAGESRSPGFPWDVTDKQIEQYQRGYDSARAVSTP